MHVLSDRTKVIVTNINELIRVKKCNSFVHCTNELTLLVSGGEGKTVYTNSTKQLLISSPPPVLILHLKRFMMENFRFKKLQRFVSFPLDLDIAPFCSTKCRVIKLQLHIL